MRITIAALFTVVFLSTAQFPDTFLGSVSVGNNPVDICVSPDGQRAYAAVEWGYATAVDITGYSDFSLAGLVSIDGTPVAAACDGTGALLYIADSENSLVHVINTTTLEIVDSFSVESSPVDMVLCSEQNRIFMSHSAGMITVISTLTGSVEDVFWAGNSLHSLTVSPDGTSIYAPDGGSPFESVISTSSGSVTRITSGMDSRAAAVSGDGNRLFLSSTDWGIITVIDTGTFSIDTTITCTGAAPTEMAGLPSLPFLYGVNSGEGVLPVYGTDDFEFKGTVSVPGEPVNIAIHPDGERIFLVCSGDNRMKVYGYDPSGAEPEPVQTLLLPSASPSVSPSIVISGVSGNVTLRGYDVSGRIVWNENVVLAPGEPAEVAIHGAPAGLLCVTAETTSGMLSGEVVVLKP